MPDREQQIIQPGKYNPDLVHQTVNALVPELAVIPMIRAGVPSRKPMTMDAIAAGLLPEPTRNDPVIRASLDSFSYENALAVDRQSIGAVLLIDQLAITDPGKISEVMAIPELYSGSYGVVMYKAAPVRALIPEITDAEIAEFGKLEDEIVDMIRKSDYSYLPERLVNRSVRGTAGFFIVAAKRLQAMGGPKLTSEKQQILQDLGVEIK